MTYSLISVRKKHKRIQFKKLTYQKKFWMKKNSGKQIYAFLIDQETITVTF